MEYLMRTTFAYIVVLFCWHQMSLFSCHASLNTISTSADNAGYNAHTNINRRSSNASHISCGLQRINPMLFNTSAYDHRFVDSPLRILPVKYRVATNEQRIGRYFQEKKISDEGSNWDVINWQLSRYGKEHRKLHCVDIGANHGIYTWHMASYFGCATQVFEMQEFLVNLMAATVHSNGLDRKVHIHKVGLSDARKTMEIGGFGGYGYLSSSTSENAVSKANSVEVYPGDDCISHKPIALMKIDVEGFELRTLLGLKNLIKGKFVDAFHIEIGPKRWPRSEISVVEGISILKELLGDYYPHLILRNADSCPGKVWPIVHSSDVALSRWGVLKHLTWDQMNKLMASMGEVGKNITKFQM